MSGYHNRELKSYDIPSSTAMVVANAIAFDAKWAVQFEEPDTAMFTNANGESRWVDMLSEDTNSYLETDLAEGFIKECEGGEYAFVAIIPKDESINANEFLASFTGEDFEEFLASTKTGDVTIKLPCFEFDYDTDLGSALTAMGAGDAFDPDLADFSGISEESPLYINKAIHSTHIKVTSEGTQAAAATVIYMYEACCEPEVQARRIIACDRPFVYAIIETSTNMPIFVGTVNNLSE